MNSAGRRLEGIEFSPKALISGAKNTSKRVARGREEGE